MAAEWYLVNDGKELGPFSVKQIKDLADSGHIQRTQLLRRADKAKPVVAEKVAGLFGRPSPENVPPANNVASQSPVKRPPPPPQRIVPSSGLPPAASNPIQPTNSSTIQSPNAATPMRASAPPPLPVGNGTGRQRNRLRHFLVFITVVALAGTAFFLTFRWDQNRRIASAIKAGDELWEKGEKEKAVAQYESVRSLLSSQNGHAYVLQRIAEHTLPTQKEPTTAAQSSPRPATALEDDQGKRHDISEDFFESFPESVDAAKYLDKELTVTGRLNNGYPIPGGQYVMLIDTEYRDVVVECVFAECPITEGTLARQYTIAGKFKGRSQKGNSQFVECRVVSTNAKPLVLKDRKRRLPRPPGSRQLMVNIDTSVDHGWWIDKDYNPSLKSVKCFATGDELVIDFDIAPEPWQKNDTMWLLPMLVRLFDKNGQYLTHFKTSEGFTLLFNVFDVKMAQYKNYPAAIRTTLHRPVLLEISGNRLAYSVKAGALRDAAIVEIGFMDDEP